jgi:hypothetical protein
LAHLPLDGVDAAGVLRGRWAGLCGRKRRPHRKNKPAISQDFSHVFAFPGEIPLFGLLSACEVIAADLRIFYLYKVLMGFIVDFRFHE